MTPLVAQLNVLQAIGTIGLQIGAIGLLVLWVYQYRAKRTNPIGAFSVRISMPLIFALSLLASILTLVYSDVFGLIPCGLCWFQRIFLYPIVFISGVALFIKDHVFARIYIIALAVPGAIIALYQHYLQMGGSELVACPASSVSCTQRFLFEFNYVTYPLMAFTLFVFVIVLLLVARSHEQTSASAA